MNKILVLLALLPFSLSVWSASTTPTGIPLDKPWKVALQEFAVKNVVHASWGYSHSERNYHNTKWISDTEGLYAGQRLRGDRDLVYVSESVLKKSWFYLANNKPVVPTEANVANVALYFVHEGDVFQIKGSAELNLPSQTVNYPAHDRKIGCVPTI